MTKEIIQELSKLDLSNPDGTVVISISLLEKLCGIIIKLEKEVQDLKDEVNRLKGEKGKPDIKGNKKDEDKNTNYSSESERNSPKPHNKSSKKENVKIDRTVRVSLDKTGLPKDLIFKGYQEHLVQNAILISDNVMYEQEEWYSPSTGRSYIASMEGLEGEEFHPDLKAMIVYLYYEMTMSEQDIHRFLANIGVVISTGTISNIITKNKSEELTEEVYDILVAGLTARIWSAIDDTGLRIDGINYFCNAIGNDLFTVYSTQSSKNRDTIKDIIFPEELRELFDILLCDDAPQFKIELLVIALCWIHELRHFKKLNPILEVNKKELERILSMLWDYYHKLLKYKKNPSEEEKEILLQEFDSILNSVVNYDELAKRMELTKAKKERLLVVLDHPGIPLHNNDMELAARTVVKKRKSSGGLRSEPGKVAWDNHFSILATCRKHGVSYLEYIKNIFNGNANPKTLAQLIKEKGDEKSSPVYA